MGCSCISATRTGRAGVPVGSISRMWTSPLLALGLVAFGAAGVRGLSIEETLSL
jgi:hypothetical protein